VLQTQIALLKKYGLPVRGFSGQHLLVDPNIQRKIIEVLQPVPQERILEIGPGLGALTVEILAAGACVIAIEKDKRFCEILEGELGDDFKGKFHIENGDVLKTDLKKLISVSRRALARSRGSKQPTRLKVISNLPYYITSPVLFWLIDNRAQVEKAVLMMQREVADRLVAQPGDKDYGRLTLAIRYYADVHRVFHVSRNCFTPRPDVDSSVVTVDFHPSSKLPKKIDERFLFHIIQVGFGARRKTLINRLAGDEEIGKTRSDLIGIFQKIGIPENARAENLLLKDFLSLAGVLQTGTLLEKETQGVRR